MNKRQTGKDRLDLDELLLSRNCFNYLLILVHFSWFAEHEV